MSEEIEVIVAYTDGSSLAGSATTSTGSGAGIHAYAYNVSPVKQASVVYKDKGLPESTVNYVAIKELPECISDHEYSDIRLNKREVKEISINDLDMTLIECHLPINGGTSQIAELLAFVTLMEAPLVATKAYHIHTDSSYLLQGIKEWMEGWKRNGWVKSTGGEISNKAIWVKIYDIVQDLKARGVKLNLYKIAAHTGRLGNEEADKLAGIASSKAVNMAANENLVGYDPVWNVTSYKCETEDEPVETEAPKKSKATKSKKGSVSEKPAAPIKPKKLKDDDKLLPVPVRLKYLYCLGGEETPVVELGGKEYYRYYGGDHAKLKDDRLLLGKAYPDAIQYLTFMEEKVDIVEKLVDESHKRTWSDTPLMYTSSLVYLLNGTFMNQVKFNARFIENDDTSDLVFNNEYNELLFDEKNWLTVAVRPPMLSFRAMDLADTLTEWYRCFLDGDRKSTKNYGVKDVTGKFFSADGKPTSFYRNIDRSFKLMAPVPGTDKEIEIIAPRNVAFPDRTYINRLIKHNLKIYLVTRKETRNAFRFFFILECDLAKQLITSYHSSLRVHG